MTPKHFSDRFRFYTIYLRKITQKNLKKKKRIVRSHLSPGMQEYVANHMRKKRNTCIKIIQFVYYTIKKRGHSQPQQNFKRSTYPKMFRFTFLGGGASFFCPPPSPGKHLGLLLREKKRQVFSPAATDET